MIRIFSPVTSGTQRKMTHRAHQCPGLTTKLGGGICISDRYMIHLYCLTVQAGFCSDMVECWPVTQTAQVSSVAAALVIRIFSPVTL